jgi:8-oxo-dGTP pyrophosphatase MutT (NUDIX family)
MRDERDTQCMPDAPGDAARRIAEARAALADLARLDEFARLLARNLLIARTAAELSQADIGERMRALGFPSWLRQTMSTVETGKRRVTAEEVVGLALALNTTVTRLVSPHDENGGQYVALPGGMVFPGRRLTYNDRSVRWDGNVPTAAPLPTAHEAAELERHSLRIRQIEDSGGEYVPAERARIGHDQEDRVQPAAEEVRPAVITAIVTSPLGVLVGHRNDDKPPWTFIAGEQEPGERVEDTAIREVKEETGLRIQVGDEIGRRVHPKTGRTMIYLAAIPTHGTEVFVGDEEELAEVRWVSLAEAEKLMAAYGMYEPVRAHLAQEIGEGER